MSQSQQSVAMGRRTKWAFVAAFCLFLVWPWIVEWITPGEINSPLPGDSVQKKLQQIETRVKDLAFFSDQRADDQAFMTRLFREGNRKVYLGEDGWLYYRPDLEAVFGKGPYYEEPSSVSREKTTDVWKAPMTVISDFAKQLRDRGIELVIVPVPTKPMACPAGLGLEAIDESGGGHFDQVLRDLKEQQIEAVNLLPVFKTLPEASRFLREDTHWTPEAMRLAAREIASVVEGKLKSGSGRAGAVAGERLRMAHSGDLAEMLDEGSKSFQEVELEIPIGVVQNDEKASVVLLGDSFVNIYDERGLGFDDENDERIGAGFAAHLSANLGASIHSIAINGDGATGVRREFASLPDDKVRSKEVVVWVLSARDLLLAELPARRAGIRWMPVEFRAPVEIGQKPSVVSDGLVVTGTVGELSRFADPRETAYKDAVYSLILSELDVEKGSHTNEEIFAFASAFKDRVLQPSSRLELGKRYRFTLVPMKDAKEVSNATQVDDLFRTDLDPWFIETFEVAP